jgi:poly-gamma-glutamate synthesis protein (capsule biosynthesis protein)
MSIDGNEIVIAAAGDIMMPVSIQSAASKKKKGYDRLFEKIRKDLGSADITFANLETPIDHRSAASGYPKFNTDPELLRAIKNAGVDILSVANNHVMDAGTEGMKRTLDNIEASGLEFVGAGRTKAETDRIKVLNARGARIAFLAYTYDTNERLPKTAAQAPGVHIIKAGSEPDLVRAADKVRGARSVADVVAVSLHWGEEYAAAPSSWQRRVAAVLVDAGADIILGHHPHVLQTVESISAADGRTALVAFSLGNFISSQNAAISSRNKEHKIAFRGDSIILRVVLRTRRQKFRVANAEFLPIWTLREASPTGILYQPVSLDREISRLKSIPQTKSGAQILNLLTYRQEVITRRLMDRPPGP